MVGLERSVLPLVGEHDFKLTSTAAILAFVVAFGLAKAITNLAAGALADRVGRKRLLVLGWLVALPVPLLIGLAPSWSFIVAANILLGINQGLAWSMTVVMKIDLAGPARRGLALGLNEAAGYLGVAATALATGALAATYAPAPWSGSAPQSSPPPGSSSPSCSYATPPRTSRSSSARMPAARLSLSPGLLRAFRTATLEHPVAARVQPGRPSQQPQRRAGLGTDAALPGRARRQRARDRDRRRGLPGRLGARAAHHRAGSPTASGASR